MCSGFSPKRYYLVDHSWASNRNNLASAEKQRSIIHIDFYETGPCLIMFVDHIDRKCVWITDTQYLLDADIPGTNKGNISVNLIEDNRVLLIEAKKAALQEERARQDMFNKYEPKYHSRERVYGQQRRYIRLPVDADSDFITAAFQDGVLHVNIPKLENVEPAGKDIKIE